MNQQPATSNQQPTMAAGGSPESLPPDAIRQCRTCLRYFVEGELVALSFGSAAAQELAGRIGHDYDCGRPECAGIAQQRRDKEKAELRRYSRTPVRREAARRQPAAGHKDRREGKKFCRQTVSGLNGDTSAVRNGLARSEDDFTPDDARALENMGPPATSHQPPATARPLTQSVVVPNLLNPGARQAEFIASGATSETDARVRDFLMAEQNFGKWFSRRRLKEVARNDLLNNIADRLRDELRPHGFDVDNCMMSESELGAKSSHYRICRVADSLRLSNDQNRNLNDESCGALDASAATTC